MARVSPRITYTPEVIRQRNARKLDYSNSTKGRAEHEKTYASMVELGQKWDGIKLRISEAENVSDLIAIEKEIRHLSALTEKDWDSVASKALAGLTMNRGQ